MTDVLSKTFIHCQGVGPTTERRLWQEGADSWQSYLELQHELKISRLVRERLTPLVEESIERLAVRDHSWFASSVPQSEHWRALPHFRRRIAYLDIETSGGFRWEDLTVVGVYDGVRLTQYVKGDNLDLVPEALEDKAMIVTFCGTGFDIPFIRRAFRLKVPQLHIDLCHLLKRLGHRGGLKRIEEQLGIRRAPELRNLSGMDAVGLWRHYCYGRDEALAVLLAYNAADVMNMELLLEYAYPRLCAATQSADPTL